MADDLSSEELPDDSSGSESGLTTETGSAIADRFLNECVTVRFVGNRTLTGFLQAIDDELARLFVSGDLILVSLATVETISLAGPDAC